MIDPVDRAVRAVARRNSYALVWATPPIDYVRRMRKYPFVNTTVEGANEFIDDGLLAVFGAPDHHPDHAQRAVAATRETGDDVLITDATRELLPRAGFDLRERSSVPLKGKQTEVRLWAPKARHQRPSAIRAARGRVGAALTAD